MQLRWPSLCVLVLMGCSEVHQTCTNDVTNDELIKAQTLIDKALAVAEPPSLSLELFRKALIFSEAEKCGRAVRLTYVPKPVVLGGAHVFDVNLQTGQVDLIYASD